MKETEAFDKWCPFAASRVISLTHAGVLRQATVTETKETLPTVRCIGSGCMAWAWDRAHVEEPEGHCGLVRG